MLMWHITLLPLCVLALVGVHVLMVRLRGVVPPFAPEGIADDAEPAATSNEQTGVEG